MYDIAVVGLGPAGAFFIRHLSECFDVIAIDKKAEEGSGGFQKPCGGLLAPDAQKALSRFNMTLPKDILVSPQIFSVRTIDLGSGIVRHYQRHYINLDRHKFDMWLIGKTPPNVRLCMNAVCTKVERVGEGYFVSYSENGVHKGVMARYVVGADGAGSIIRRSLHKDVRLHKYLSIQQWFPDAHETSFYSCVFDPEITDSYAWGLTKNEHFIFGGAFSIKTGKADFAAMKEKLRAYGFRLENPVRTQAALVLRPMGMDNYCHGADGAFLVGEAAGFISPSSLEGISYAIDSGYLLAKCLNAKPVDPNRDYIKRTCGIRRKLMLKKLKRPFMYNPVARRIIMKSGFSSIQIID